MAEIVEISEDNLDVFSPLLGEDLSDDVKRVYYNGLGVADEDDRPLGAFVYELLNSDSEEDTKSRICFFKYENKEISDDLEKYYSDNSVKTDEVVESIYKTSEEGDTDILAKAGFSFAKKEDDRLTVTLSDLCASKIGKKRKIPDYVGNIEELTILEFRDAVKTILFKGHTGIMEDIPYLPKTWFDNGISACVRSGGKITGLFLIRRNPSGVLIPVLFFAYGPESNKNLLFMMQYSLRQASQAYPPDTIVEINRNSIAIKAVTDNILPDRQGEEIFFGTRKEQ